MNGLLAALTVFIGMLGGNNADDGATSPAAVEINTTTTTMPVSPHVISEKLNTCDKISDTDERNLCYAKATGDRFFCDRIKDSSLKTTCRRIIKTN
ncbi:MAG: hypothetical protein PHG85_00535 [Candidatus Altiarchaeota archaeon]|nr:hypothetical protein [Candidatus Altiarchaeota archaeon]